jgi:hypothetical protein
MSEEMLEEQAHPSFLQGNADEGHDLSIGNGAAYKFVQWVDRVPAADPKTFQGKGGPFIPEDQFPLGFVPSRPLDVITFESGDQKAGLGFTMAYLSILAYRLDWFTAGQDRRKVFYPDYNTGERLVGKGNVRGRTRFVCLIKNDDLWRLGPLMITVNGTRGRALQKAISDFDNMLRRTLERKYNRRWAVYDFWAPIKASPEKIKASENYQKFTFPPVLALTIPFDVDEIGGKAYISDEVRNIAAASWDDAQAWATAPVMGEFGEPSPDLVTDEEEPARSGGTFQGRGQSVQGQQNWSNRPAFGSRGDSSDGGNATDNGDIPF